MWIILSFLLYRLWSDQQKLSYSSSCKCHFNFFSSLSTNIGMEKNIIFFTLLRHTEMFKMTGDRKCKNNVMGKSGIAVLDSVTSFYGFVLDDDSHFENFFVQVERTPFWEVQPPQTQLQFNHILKYLRTVHDGQALLCTIIPFRSYFKLSSFFRLHILK